MFGVALLLGLGAFFLFSTGGGKASPDSTTSAAISVALTTLDPELALPANLLGFAAALAPEFPDQAAQVKAHALSLQNPRQAFGGLHHNP